MVLDIFQLLMSDVTHLKRLKRLEIYWKFQWKYYISSQSFHVSQEILEILFKIGPNSTQKAFC